MLQLLGCVKKKVVVVVVMFKELEILEIVWKLIGLFGIDGVVVNWKYDKNKLGFEVWELKMGECTKN